MGNRLEDRMALKALVDYYATESDRNNQDCFRKIDGRWWIAEREQRFEWTALPPLA